MAAVVTSLDRLTLEPVDVELPEACPGCGQDFSEPSSLVEIGFMATHRTCRLVTDGVLTVVAEHETSDVTDEYAIATGFRCGGCRKILALETPRHRTGAAEKEDAART